MERQPGLIAVNGSDTTTELLRVVLMLTAAAGAWIVRRLYHRAHDVNPIPWLYLSFVFIVYAAAMAALLIGSQLVVTEWFRPLFSTLNVNLMVASLWVIARAVRYRHRDCV